jgi:CO/xanthine dehydrogenase FAD-binding subunit
MQPEFDLLMPATLDEALSFLAEHPDVAPIAGGTNVLVGMREGLYTNRTLLDLNRLEELTGIRVEDGSVVIGGRTTVAELLDSPIIAAHAKPLHRAARTFANPLVRNRATVAGNLVDASPAADTAPPLLALNAEVELVSLSGTRRLPLDEFMVGVNQTLRRPDELLLSIRWPVPATQSAGAFHKLALRKGTACSVISAAATVEGNGAGSCAQARIALGAVAVRPIRVYAAEEGLTGQHLTADAIERAAAQAISAAQPIDDVRSTASYRKQMAGVLVRRLLTQIGAELERGGQE